jgi:hypothetical protein
MLAIVYYFFTLIVSPVRRMIFPAADRAKEKVMSEPTPAIETTPETKSGKLIRQILKWIVLGLLLLTCIMAAYRKFGG